MTLSGVDSADAFDRILDSVRQLPSPPMICMAVAEATQSDLTTLSLLQRLIESDIALSGRTPVKLCPPARSRRQSGSVSGRDPPSHAVGGQTPNQLGFL